MNSAELTTFAASDYLVEGNRALLQQVKPAFATLLQRLHALPDSATQAERLAPFEQALVAINAFENDIETVERETILGAIYQIGSIVGLSPQSQFAEAWRGDW